MWYQHLYCDTYLLKSIEYKKKYFVYRVHLLDITLSEMHKSKGLGQKHVYTYIINYMIKKDKKT